MMRTSRLLIILVIVAGIIAAIYFTMSPARFGVQSVPPLPDSGHVVFDAKVAERNDLYGIADLRVVYGGRYYFVLSATPPAYYQIGQTYHFDGNRRANDGVIEIRSSPPMLPTRTPVNLAALPTLSRDKNTVGIWTDTHGYAHRIAIRKVNGSYQMSEFYSDSSGKTVTLYVKVVNGEERLYEDPENYSGEYMVIKKNGNLAYFDNAGIIYELPPE